MDFEKCCRICLESAEYFLDLEEIYDEERQLNNRKILELITNISITQERDFPMQICCTCGGELQMCYNFQKKVEYSNNILKNIEPYDEDTEPIMSISYLEDSEGGEVEEVLERASTESDTNLSDTEIKQEVTYELLNDITADDEVGIADNQPEMKVEKVENEEDENFSLTLVVCDLVSDSSSKNVQEITFECKNCYKKFDNEKKLSSHLNCHNPNRPRFQCTDCSRIYVTKQAMETHVSTVHEKKGFKCKFCDKIFAIRKGLIIHMRYHTGDFPYECDQCDRKFAQLCHLKTHIKVKHKNARFTCEYANCNKLFTNSASLRNHEFTHSTMPFNCEYCDKGYPAKSKLRVHIRRTHGKEMSIEELERMRVFRVCRTPLKLVELDSVLR